MDRRSFFKGLLSLTLVGSLPKITVLEKITRLWTPTPTPSSADYLARSSLWSQQIKETIRNDLVSMKFVKILKEDYDD